MYGLNCLHFRFSFGVFWLQIVPDFDPDLGLFLCLDLAHKRAIRLGDAFLDTVTGWVVGFFVALIFAGLSYLFYLAAVAILSGSLGYALTVGLLGAIGLEMGFLVWLIAIVVAVIFAVVVLRFNIQKYVIIIATAHSVPVRSSSRCWRCSNLTLIQWLKGQSRLLLTIHFLWLLFLPRRCRIGNRGTDSS